MTQTGTNLRSPVFLPHCAGTKIGSGWVRSKSPRLPRARGGPGPWRSNQWWSWYDRNSPWDWLLCNIEAKILLFWVADPHWSSFFDFWKWSQIFLNFFIYSDNFCDSFSLFFNKIALLTHTYLSSHTENVLYLYTSPYFLIQRECCPCLAIWIWSGQFQLSQVTTEKSTA